MDADRRTMMVRARTLVRDVVVLKECHGPSFCTVPAGRHGAPYPGTSVFHAPTLLDAEVLDEQFSAIAVQEDGIPCAYTTFAGDIVRVYADTVMTGPEPPDA